MLPIKIWSEHVYCRQGSILVDANVELERNGENETAVETEMKMEVENVVNETISGPPADGFTFDPNYLTVMDPEPNVLQNSSTQEPDVIPNSSTQEPNVVENSSTQESTNTMNSFGM